MQFTAGDDIALGMFALALLGVAVREWRSGTTKAATIAAAEASKNSIISTLGARIDDMARSYRELEDKRQKHEIDCVKIQERTAASMERTAEILRDHTRDITALQAQIRHVASGASGRIVEIRGKE